MFLIMHDTGECSFLTDSISEARFWASFPAYVVIDMTTREHILN